MKVTLRILTVLCLLLLCSPAIAQEVTLETVREATPKTVIELPSETPALPTIFLAVPADAYGFAATNNLQASYDNIMAFGQALGVGAGPPENQLLAIQEMLGEIDLNGPAAAILLDPQKFSEPVALLFSAADAQAVFETLKAEAGDAEEDLPPGVVKFDTDDYVGVKNGFIVFAPQADNVAAVLASQMPLEVMPAAIQAFAQGQIVLAGDLEQAAPFLIQSLDGFKAMATGQMAGPAGQMPQMATAMDMFSLYFDFAQSIIQQGDKLAIGLDINAEQAILTKRILFKADSEAAAFVNAQTDQELPSYAALPGGAFLLAATSNINAEQINTLMENVLNKFVSLPSFEEKFSAEHAAQMVSAMKDFYTGSANTAMTFNIGTPSPTSGMFNMVARYEVPDSADFMKKTGEMYQAPDMAAWMGSFWGPAKYFHTSAAENYSGVDIDTIKMEIAPPEIDDEADPQVQQMQMMMAQQMQMMMPMMYGPDMSFRLAAPSDKQVLFVMGGSERMEQAINVAQGNDSALADDPKIAQATAKLPASRFAEAHLDLGQVVPMMGMFAAMAGGPPMPLVQAPVTPPVSFSTSAEPDTLRADMVVPSESVGALVQTFMAMQMQMMQQHEGPGSGPQTAPSDDFKEDDF